MKKRISVPRLLVLALVTLLMLSSVLPASRGQPTSSLAADAASLDPARPSLAPAAAGTITGTVTDGGGNPIGGIGVGAGGYSTILDCGGGTYWTSTDPNGTYQLDVPDGTYLVFVNSHGWPGHYLPEAYRDVNNWSQIAAATPVTVTDGQTVTHVGFSLPSGFTVSGRLVDGRGQPVPGAGGNIRDPLQGIEFGCALGFGSSDADGTFRVNVPAGTYDLGFCKGTSCFTVRKGLEITDHLALGDVTFAEAPEPPRVFAPAVLEPGYTVAPVVPGGPNTPSDVAVISNTVYLAAIRSWNVYQVGTGGTLTSTAAVGVYALDAGPDGNLYGYFMPFPSPVYRITPTGVVATLGHLPMTSCESTLAVAPNGDIWIGHNYCGGTGFGDGTLYRMTQAGQVITVATGLPFGINGLDLSTGGQLYMTLGHEVYRVNTATGSRTLFATLPGSSSFHGLVVAPDGSLYVSSQGFEHDLIFKVTPAGNASVLATLPAGCVQGLDRLPGGDLIATMRCTGALYRVHADGTWETLLPGNGIATPQAMAFNLSGELLVNNDESGRITRIRGGRGEFFAAVASYIPPLGHLALERSGDLYFSEGCPGFQSRLIRISPRGEITEVTRDVSFPSGLAFTPGGTLYVAENLSGQVSSVSAEGTVTTFVDGLTRPQSMAADGAGNLYVVGYEGPLSNPTDPADNPTSNRIWKIDPAGNRTLYATTYVNSLAFSPAGELFISGPVGRQSGVLRVAPDGADEADEYIRYIRYIRHIRSATPFAQGFLSAVGLAFDLAGDLYVSDDWDNSITRITGFPQGAIQGSVTDAQSSQPLPAANLTVVTGYPVVLGQPLVTDGRGHYSLLAAPRTYTVTASARGYRSLSQQITVQADVTATVDLALTPWASQVCLPLVLKQH